MLRCLACGSVWGADEVRYRCDCGGTLEFVLAPDPGLTRATFEARHRSREPLDRSGVWRYRELLPPIDPRLVVTAREGNSHHDRHPAVSAFAGVDVILDREDRNPTGS